MSTDSKNKTKIDCPVCYSTHDEEIHDATLRLRRWFLEQVTRNFEDDPRSVPVPQSELVAS